MSVLWIALGGSIGAVLRYETVKLAERLFGSSFPYGTMIVNIIGSFCMGWLAVYVMDKVTDSQHQDILRRFIMIGLLGGFTTFSAFSNDAMAFMQQAQWFKFASYVVGSVCVSMAALALGWWIGAK